LKICDLTQFYSPVSGGVKRYLEQKVAFLQRHYPDDRHVLIIPGEANTRTNTGAATVHTIRSPLVSRTSRYRMLLDLVAVERILEEETPSIIESGDPYQMAWKAVFSGRALGIPVVGFYHSHFPEAYLRSVAKYFGKMALEITSEVAMRYVRALYNRFERTLVPSPALAALLTEWGVENTINIDLGVDTVVFRPHRDPVERASERAALESELSIPPDRILLLYTGRLASEKNVRTLFQAFALLHHDEPRRFHLLCVGDGTLRGPLRRLQEDTGEVSWMSYCAEAPRLAALYRAADLFVHPSINETFGLVTLESQACGTPVIGIRGSYMDRIIFSDMSHWAAENTAAALAGAVRDMAGQDLRQAGAGASQMVRTRYSWDVVFTQMRREYEAVIREFQP
jgi:alpha-1,6-mannosyltransferase